MTAVSGLIRAFNAPESDTYGSVAWDSTKSGAVSGAISAVTGPLGSAISGAGGLTITVGGRVVAQEGGTLALAPVAVITVNPAAATAIGQAVAYVPPISNGLCYSQAQGPGGGSNAARPFGELVKDANANPSKWQVARKEVVASTNMRNNGGTSVQELLRNSDTGEEIVRHTLLGPDGSLFEAPHFRPFWK